MSDDSQPREHVERAQPETFRARAMSASLTVDDVEASLAWYRDAMGFFVDQRYEDAGELHAVALAAGSVRILLHQDDWERGRDRTKGEGFSLHFTTAQDVDELAARIREHGGELESEPADMPWGTRSFRVRDPSGFALVVSSEGYGG